MKTINNKITILHDYNNKYLVCQYNFKRKKTTLVYKNTNDLMVCVDYIAL